METAGQLWEDAQGDLTSTVRVVILLVLPFPLQRRQELLQCIHGIVFIWESKLSYKIGARIC